MKHRILLVLFVMLILMTINVLTDELCDCCFALTSLNCLRRSIKSCSQCTRQWCEENVDFCRDNIPPCFTRCNQLNK